MELLKLDNGKMGLELNGYKKILLFKTINLIIINLFYYYFLLVN